MTDINAEIINWVKFAKGDVPGHAFHGNQWSAGQMSGETHAGADREHSNLAVRDASQKISALRNRMLTTGTKVNDLNRLSLLHSALAGIHADRGDLKEADANLHASDVAHQTYIKALGENNGEGKAYLPTFSDLPSAAHQASNDALTASFNSMVG